MCLIMSRAHWTLFLFKMLLLLRYVDHHQRVFSQSVCMYKYVCCVDKKEEGLCGGKRSMTHSFTIRCLGTRENAASVDRHRIMQLLYG